MKMPATSSMIYTEYEEPKYFNNYLKKTNINANVGAFKTQKLDQYTLENLAKFVTYSIYSIWDSMEQDLYYPQNNLISYFQQTNMVNENFEHFQDYCQKILGATETSFSLCLCALKIIDRLRSINSDACGSDGFEYRIFIAAYIIAYKYFTERSINNKAWEPICGMEVSQINIMEIEMLFGISFNINISSEEFLEWIQEIDMMFSNNITTSVWYLQEIKPILSTIASETRGIIINEESLVCHDSQDTSVDNEKSSTSKPMMNYCRINSISSSSTLVNSTTSEISFEEDSLLYDNSFSLSPLSDTSNKSSSILTR